MDLLAYGIINDQRNQVISWLLTLASKNNVEKQMSQNINELIINQISGQRIGCNFSVNGK